MNRDYLASLQRFISGGAAMTYMAALIYWIIVALWLTGLCSVVYVCVRNPRAFVRTRLLLAVLLPKTTKEAACTFAGRVCGLVRATPLSIGEEKLPLTISIGLPMRS
jgi:hypothetical protein